MCYVKKRYMLKGMHKKERENKEAQPKSQNHQKGEKENCAKRSPFSIHHIYTHMHILIRLYD
jgi:hypothetical protein